MRVLPRVAILFDLFHTLACVPTPAAVGETPISEIPRMLGVYYPERIAERRVHADWEFEDVPALVDALGL